MNILARDPAVKRSALIMNLMQSIPKQENTQPRPCPPKRRHQVHNLLEDNVIKTINIDSEEDQYILMELLDESYV